MKVKEHYKYRYPAGTVLVLTKPIMGKPSGAEFMVVDTDDLCQLHGVFLPPYDGCIVVRADEEGIRPTERKKENKSGLETRICTRCGKSYCDYPATSRADGKTQICPDCGIMEALEKTNMSEEEKKELIDTVRRHSGKGGSKNC